MEPKFQLYSAGIKWSPLLLLRQRVEIVISVAFGIVLTKVSYCNKFHCNQLPLSVALSSETLSCRQRDLRMFVIYKLCGVGNEF